MKIVFNAKECLCLCLLYIHVCTYIHCMYKHIPLWTVKIRPYLMFVLLESWWHSEWQTTGRMLVYIRRCVLRGDSHATILFFAIPLCSRPSWSLIRKISLQVSVSRTCHPSVCVISDPSSDITKITSKGYKASQFCIPQRALQAAASSVDCKVHMVY